MKKLKTFESYLSDKMLSIKDKFNKLKKIIDFINKYKLKYFVISMETANSDYMFEEISKGDGGDYYLRYDSYEGKESTSHNTEISELPYNVVDELISICESEHRFTVEFHLESIADIETFINILKKYKEPIDFSVWMFSLLIENELQDEANSFKFQNILLSTHPEAFNEFMNECLDSQKRAKPGGYTPLKVAPGIKTKYKSLFHDYEVYKSSKKYNL